MKQRFFLFVSIFALLLGVLVFSGTGSQAVAQQRPPGGDSIPVQPPSPPDDPGNKESDVKVKCSSDKYNLCGVQCIKCGVRYYDSEFINGYATSYSGKCGKCNGLKFRPIKTN